MSVKEIISKQSGLAVIVGSLLLIHFALAVTSAKSKSATFDEPAHLISGLTYWHFGDYRLNPENGNLPQRLIAIPVMLFADYQLPERDQSAWRESDVWTLADQFLTENRQSARSIIWLGRLSTSLLSSGLCLTVFLWSKKVFGMPGGVVSLAMATFSPTLLAHAGLMTSDTCFSLFFLLATGAIWSFLNRMNPFTLLMTTLAVGALFLSKLSAVLVIPVAFVLILVVIFRRQPLIYQGFGHRGNVVTRTGRICVLVPSVLVVTLFTWITVWCAFGFRFSAASTDSEPQTFYKFGTVAEAARECGTVGRIINELNYRLLLPEAWNYGAAFVAAHSKARFCFLNGEVSTHGWWYFFPYTVLVKTPLPVWILLLTALTTILRETFRRATSARTETPQPFVHLLPLAVVMTITWPIFLSSNLNIGHRHVLLTYPIAFILIGAVGRGFEQSRMNHRFAVVLLVAGLAFESLATFPDYLAYFNQLVGRKNGWKHLVDSSLDWGQDLPALSRYLRENKEEPVYLSYFGTENPGHFGIRWKPLPADLGAAEVGVLDPGLYCISATNLQGVYNRMPPPWTKQHQAAFDDFVIRMQSYQQKPMDEILRLHESGDPDLQAAVAAFNHMRTYRLFAWLRKQTPDAMAGGSILIFDLTQKEIDDALWSSTSTLR